MMPRGRTEPVADTVVLTLLQQGLRTHKLLALHMNVKKAALLASLLPAHANIFRHKLPAAPIGGSCLTNAYISPEHRASRHILLVYRYWYCSWSWQMSYHVPALGPF